MCRRVGGLERESDRGGEDKRMGAVKSVNRGALHLLDVLAACPTWLIVIEA